MASHRNPFSRRSRALRRAPARAGLTLLELAVALTILTIAFLMYSSTAISANRQRDASRENSIASDATREMLETLRSVPLAEVYGRYNHEGSDDPGVPGSAPGHRWVVASLNPIPGMPDGTIGEVQFPEMEVAEGVWELREDLVRPELGMPRDLNGDSIIDSRDHSDDYVMLPVRVVLAWQGRFGPRVQGMNTQLVDYRR